MVVKKHDIKADIFISSPLRPTTLQAEFLPPSHPRPWLLQQHMKQASEHLTQKHPSADSQQTQTFTSSFFSGFNRYLSRGERPVTPALSAAECSFTLTQLHTGSCSVFSPPVSLWAAPWERFAVMQLYSRFSTLQKRRTMFGFSDPVQKKDRMPYIFIDVCL